MESKPGNILKLKRKRLDPSHRDKLVDDPDMLSLCEKATSIGMEVLGVYDKEEIDAMPLDELPPGLYAEQFKRRNTKKE